MTTDHLDDAATLRARLAESQAALDRFQAAAIQAQAEAEHYRDRAGAAEQDLAAETIRANEVEREVARLRQELECRAESPR